MGQGNDRTHDRIAALVAVHRRDEGAVDLERVAREVVEEGERRVAGAEVVDLGANAEALQVVERRAHAIRLVHHRALGDLEPQSLGQQVVRLQRVNHVRHEVGLAELPAGDVHAHGHVVAHQAPLAPVDEVRACLVQDQAAQRSDQPGVLRYRDELVRIDLRPGRRPAGQRLQAAEAARIQVHDRLVEDPQLPLLDREPELGLQVHLADHLRAHLLVEDRRASRALALGVVHRDVGVAQEVARLAGAVADGYPDAGGHEQLAPIDVERLAETLLDPSGDLGGLALRPDAAEQDRELVAPEPGDGVTRAQAAA